MSTIDDVFFEFEQPGEPRIQYLICAVPRSGSNLLCDLMTSTGVAGRPTELFHPDMMRMLKRRWGIETTPDYIARLLARKTSPNGVFGTKVHWGQYHPLFDRTDPRELFPNLHVIFLSRRDHLRQAISWVRAVQTMSWQSTHDERHTAEFDAEHIGRKVGRIEREVDAWRSLFERYGIDALEVVYEDLVADQAGTVDAALAHLGVEPPPGFTVDQPQIKRQADALSDEWVERYRAEAAQA